MTRLRRILYREQISVLDYGAKGDGVKDDTSAIQAALDAAVYAGGGVVLVPVGVYRCDARFIDIGEGVSLYGEGANVSRIVDSADRSSGVQVSGDAVTIKGIGVERLGTSGVNYGVYVTNGASGVTVKDCSVESPNSNMLGFFGFQGTSGLTVQDCFFDTAGSIHFWRNVSDVRVVGNECVGFRGQGAIMFSGDTGGQAHADRVLIADNYLHSPFEGGPESGGYPIRSQGAGGRHRDMVVRGNVVVGNDKSFLYDSGLPDLIAPSQVEGLIVENNIATHGGDSGISLEMNERVTVTGNFTAFNEVAGMYVNVTDAAVSGNVSMNNGQDRFGGGGEMMSGIVCGAVVPSVNVAVVGNRSGDDQVVKTQHYGIRVDGSSIGVELVGNMLGGNRDGEVLDRRV